VEVYQKNEIGKFQEAEQVELVQIDSYSTSWTLEKKRRHPQDKHSCVYMVYDVFKHDGHYKARLVAGGHLTETPIESDYSRVLLLRELHLAIFSAELNHLEIEQQIFARTQEKLYNVARPDLGCEECHILNIHKAIYGLKLLDYAGGKAVAKYY